ncbi:hypothetical protein EDC01DRAFT_627721 [Geopyxis carbonaria]|nr:hypothetical protein EDC01DRAFT_627721 [Geopyxis carbonaria]
MPPLRSARRAPPVPAPQSARRAPYVPAPRRSRVPPPAPPTPAPSPLPGTLTPLYHPAPKLTSEVIIAMHLPPNAKVLETLDDGTVLVWTHEGRVTTVGEVLRLAGLAAQEPGPVAGGVGGQVPVARGVRPPRGGPVPMDPAPKPAPKTPTRRVASPPPGAVAGRGWTDRRRAAVPASTRPVAHALASGIEKRAPGAGNLAMRARAPMVMMRPRTPGAPMPRFLRVPGCPTPPGALPRRARRVKEEEGTETPRGALDRARAHQRGRLGRTPAKWAVSPKVLSALRLCRLRTARKLTPGSNIRYKDTRVGDPVAYRKVDTTPPPPPSSPPSPLPPCLLDPEPSPFMGRSKTTAGRAKTVDERLAILAARGAVAERVLKEEEEKARVSLAPASPPSLVDLECSDGNISYTLHSLPSALASSTPVAAASTVLSVELPPLPAKTRWIGEPPCPFVGNSSSLRGFAQHLRAGESSGQITVGNSTGWQQPTPARKRKRGGGDVSTPGTGKRTRR